MDLLKGGQNGVNSLTHPEDEESFEGVAGHVRLERVGVVAGHSAEAPHEGHEEEVRRRGHGSGSGRRRCHLTNVHSAGLQRDEKDTGVHNHNSHKNFVQTLFIE